MSSLKLVFNPFACLYTNRFTIIISLALVSRPAQSLASQFAAIPDEATKVASIEDLPTITITGSYHGQYILETWLHRKRKRSSWISKHGLYLVKISDSGTASGEFWLCGLCDSQKRTKLFDSKATSSSMQHLLKDHQISEANNTGFLPST